jgi:hypothetical protein
MMECWNIGFAFIIPLFQMAGIKIEADTNQIGNGNGNHSLKSLPSTQIVQK